MWKNAVDGPRAVGHGCETWRSVGRGLDVSEIRKACYEEIFFRLSQLIGNLGYISGTISARENNSGGRVVWRAVGSGASGPGTNGTGRIAFCAGLPLKSSINVDLPPRHRSTPAYVTRSQIQRDHSRESHNRFRKLLGRPRDATI